MSERTPLPVTGDKFFPTVSGLAWIYELHNRDGCFYVGITVDPQARLNAHYKSDTKAGDLLRKSSGWMLIVEEHQDYDLALIAERDRISRYPKGSLTNKTPGQLSHRAHLLAAKNNLGFPCS